MNIHQVRRLIRLHEKAARHSDKYERLSELNAQSKALRHLRQAERFYSQIRGMIRDCASVKVSKSGLSWPEDTEP
jgi:hypothetical protein